MIARHARRRAFVRGATLGVLILAGGCASQPSIGPNTATGLPGHVDGGARQVLRFCEMLHDAGDLTKAAAICERAHHLNPNLPEPLLELASILGDMHESELSLQAYRTVLQTSPDNAAAHYGAGRIYLEQGQHDLALAEFQAALRGSPKDPKLFNTVGVAHGLLGGHAEAQQVFREGLQIAPNDRSLRNNLGLSLVQSGLYDEGVAILAALGKDPGVEQASRENLQMAQGLAAAARAEALIAEARAEAEAKAAAAAKARMAAFEALALAVPVSYQQSSWPMDGPGEDGMRPVGALTEMPGANQPPQGEMARASAPTPLTQAIIAPPTHRAAASPQRSTPPRSPVQQTQAPRSLTRATGPQTARADFGGVADIEIPMVGPDDPIAWTPRREIMKTVPGPLTNVPAQAAAGPPDKPTVGEAYAVQIASYTSEERAWRGWDTLQVQATEQLKNVEPKVQRADLGGEIGIVYRLQTAPDAKARTETLCEALKAGGIDCMVVKATPKLAASGGRHPATL